MNQVQPEVHSRRRLDVNHGDDDASGSSARASRTAILTILQKSNGGGMERAASGLMNSLSGTGQFSFRIASPRPFGRGLEAFLQHDPLSRDFEYKGRYGWRSFRFFQSHVSALTRETETIWISGPCAFALAAVLRLPGRKVLSHSTHHFDEPSSMLRWFGFYYGLCRQLHAITFPSKFSRDEALNVAPWLEGRSHVIRYGYEVCYEGEAERLRRRATARAQLNLPADAFVVGNAGTLIEKKRFDVFLRTAARVKEELPGAYFVVCGTGPVEREVQSLAAELGIADAVRFCGWVEDLTPHYEAWDVCLFNSDFEAIGNTPLEAAAHGCPTIASVEYGGLDEFITHGTSGFLIAKHDIEQLAGAVLSLANDPQKASMWRDAAAERLRACFSPSVAADLYRSILS